MKNMSIRITGAMAHQYEGVKNVYVYVDGILRSRYITRNVSKIVDILKEDAEDMNVEVVEIIDEDQIQEMYEEYYK